MCGSEHFCVEKFRWGYYFGGQLLYGHFWLTLINSIYLYIFYIETFQGCHWLYGMLFGWEHFVFVRETVDNFWKWHYLSVGTHSLGLIGYYHSYFRYTPRWFYPVSVKYFIGTHTRTNAHTPHTCTYTPCTIAPQ